MKKIFIIISLLTLLFPWNILAKENIDIDTSKNLTVKISKYVDIDTFEVTSKNKTFNVSLFGIDTVKTLEKDGINNEDLDKNIYTKLLRAHTVTLEFDDNLYNKDGEIQAWIWIDNELLQNYLVSNGLAIVDANINEYSLCEKYCSLLKNSQENAKNSLIGMWGADDYTLNYNVGGKKISMIKLGTSQFIIMGSIVGLLIILLIITILIIKKKNKTEIKTIEKRLEKIEDNVILEEKPENNELQEEQVKDEEKISDNIENEILNDKISEKDCLELKNIDVENKTILLNILPTLFNPKDSRSKEVPETIKLEMVVVDDNLESQKYSWYVKPVKYPKLTSFCKERCDVTQIEVNNGKLFKNIILELIPIFEKCDSIYSWGKSSLLQLQKESKEKLDSDDYLKLCDILNKKYINYKEDFAERNEITPCSLIKAADLSDQVKEKDAVDTMLNIYKIERM